ncbi:LysR substrate-binding domain-containing protein [Vibrio sp. 10N.261.55.A7]|uniref:LysR substrate-binding domain-containing protein n=1 Tax=Vibrio sp. 10N.261.55.A7 TaxID=1880851 RepID=UPI000C8268CD|nr:LysR substrate-binding domain-containing protein [Vibrio sp. 10N.261.55.A7]PMJ89925.1 LysR family transcriptional regulator [Vibrio sp. 10N.261.55.A7]
MKHLKSNMASALMTFVEVGKRGSLTGAAKAKCLTTGAISQQLLQLESNMGIKLVDRHSRGVTLTEAGHLLHRVASSSFQDIDTTIANLQSSSADASEVRLKLTPSFAFKWLVPRLEDFHRLHPDIQVQTYAEGALVDRSSQDFDLAIDYGPMPYSEPNAELLLEEKLIPVMSPQYLTMHPWLAEEEANVHDWSAITLLHDAQPWAGAIRQQEWQYWAKSNQANLLADKGHFFNRTDMAMSAAEAGVGIALARKALIQDELISGRLVAPLAAISAQAGYFLHTHTNSIASRSFANWVREQVQTTTSPTDW